MIDEQLAAFLQEGIAIHIGTRNARLEPNGARVAAVTVEPGGQHIVVYVPSVAAAPLMADLQENGQAALNFGRPIDHRACQVKGVFDTSWDATPRERPFVMDQWRRNLAQFDAIGLPGMTMQRWRMWPCVAVRMRVTALFDQTPGPGAGAPLS